MPGGGSFFLSGASEYMDAEVFHGGAMLLLMQDLAHRDKPYSVLSHSVLQAP